MGDRARVRIMEQEGSVWLYTHWSGTELPSVVRSVLARHERWSDVSYLARMIFCAMVDGKESESTGFGISASEPDNTVYRPTLVIDCDAGMVRLGTDFGTDILLRPAWTFEEFVSLPADVSWELLESRK